MKIANRSVTTIVAISAALVLVFAAPGVAAEITLYEENFEGIGTGPGDMISHFGYDPKHPSVFQDNWPVGTSTLLGTRASLKPIVNVHRGAPLTNPIPLFSVEPILSFSFDLIGTNATLNDDWAGLAPTSGCCENTGIFIGQRLGQWAMDASPLSGTAGSPLPNGGTDIFLGGGTNAGFETPVTVEVNIDEDATGNELSVKIFDRATPSTVYTNDTFALSAGDLSIIEGFTTFRLQILADTSTGTDRGAIEVDNIKVTSGVIPEPTSLALLACGLIGVVACGRRRLR